MTQRAGIASSLDPLVSYERADSIVDERTDLFVREKQRNAKTCQAFREAVNDQFETVSDPEFDENRIKLRRNSGLVDQKATGYFSVSQAFGHQPYDSELLFGQEGNPLSLGIHEPHDRFDHFVPMHVIRYNQEVLCSRSQFTNPIKSTDMVGPSINQNEIRVFSRGNGQCFETTPRLSDHDQAGLALNGQPNLRAQIRTITY
jgi:hypothetical protein